MEWGYTLMYKINETIAKSLEAGDVIQSKEFGYIEIIISNDKEAGKVTVIDLFNGNKERTLKLHQSKQDGYQYYFKMNKRSYWLHLLYQKKEG